MLEIYWPSEKSKQDKLSKRKIKRTYIQTNNNNRSNNKQTTYLIYEAFQILLPTKIHWFLQLRSFFIKWNEKERSIKLRPLRIDNGAWLFWNFEFTSYKKFRIVYILWCLTRKKKNKKNTSKLSRVPSMYGKSQSVQELFLSSPWNFTYLTLHKSWTMTGERTISFPVAS